MLCGPVALLNPTSTFSVPILRCSFSAILAMSRAMSRSVLRVGQLRHCAWRSRAPRGSSERRLPLLFDGFATGPLHEGKPQSSIGSHLCIPLRPRQAIFAMWTCRFLNQARSWTSLRSSGPHWLAAPVTPSVLGRRAPTNKCHLGNQVRPVWEKGSILLAWSERFQPNVLVNA